MAGILMQSKQMPPGAHESNGTEDRVWGPLNRYATVCLACPMDWCWNGSTMTSSVPLAGSQSPPRPHLPPKSVVFGGLTARSHSFRVKGAPSPAPPPLPGDGAGVGGDHGVPSNRAAPFRVMAIAGALLSYIIWLAV